MVSFDRSHFDKWYRSPVHRVRTGAVLRRHAALAVSTAEHILERAVRHVLDIGAGEGEWRSVLRSLRPRATYRGIEPSEYAVRRYGQRRNLLRGGFGTIGGLDDLERFDLIVCVDVLHYLERAEIVNGARVLGRRLRGVAWLHLFAREDAIRGDTRRMNRQPARWYREAFRAAGLRPIGLGFWVGRGVAGGLSALERMR